MQNLIKKSEILYIKRHHLQKVKTQAKNWEKIFSLHKWKRIKDWIPKYIKDFYKSIYKIETILQKYLKISEQAFCKSKHKWSINILKCAQFIGNQGNVNEAIWDTITTHQIYKGFKIWQHQLLTKMGSKGKFYTLLVEVSIGSIT